MEGGFDWTALGKFMQSLENFVDCSVMTPPILPAFNDFLSYPGNLAKSNSEDLQTSPVSSPELCSNKSLCQKSDILLIH